jgi:hypothetical protein
VCCKRNNLKKFQVSTLKFSKVKRFSSQSFGLILLLFYLD